MRKRIEKEAAAVDTMLRRVSRRYPEALLRLFNIQGKVEISGWVETQVVARQRRVDRALAVVVDGREHQLHVEWTDRWTREVKERVSDYNQLISEGARIDTYAKRKKKRHCRLQRHKRSRHRIVTQPHSMRQQPADTSASPFCESRAKTESMYEQYHYEPGSFWLEPGQGGDTPIADDNGVARTNEREAQSRVQRELDAARRTRRVVLYKTNVLDLSPGSLMMFQPHPCGDISGRNLLVIHSQLEGTPDQEWTIAGDRGLFRRTVSA